MEIYKEDKLVTYKRISNINLDDRERAINILSKDAYSNYYFSDTIEPHNVFRMSFK